MRGNLKLSTILLDYYFLDTFIRKKKKSKIHMHKMAHNTCLSAFIFGKLISDTIYTKSIFQSDLKISMTRRHKCSYIFTRYTKVTNQPLNTYIFFKPRNGQVKLVKWTNLDVRAGQTGLDPRQPEFNISIFFFQVFFFNVNLNEYFNVLNLIA